MYSIMGSWALNNLINLIMKMVTKVLKILKMYDLRMVFRSVSIYKK
jgi:hypothetical protein